MRLLSLFALTVCATALLLGLAPSSQAKEPSTPSFKPGAEVTLSVKLKAPGGWKINFEPPIRVSFDKEQLKNAGFTVGKERFDFKLSKYVHEYTVSIPIKLKGGLKDGALTIPAEISCSICDERGVRCSFVNEELQVKLQVRAKAPAGEKDQAQAQGTLSAEHKFSPPV